MCRYVKFVAVASAVVLAVTLAPAAWGFTSGSGTGTGVSGSYNSNSSGEWNIGSIQNPIGITLDPNAGPWTKTLGDINGNPIQADDTGSVWKAGPFPINEFVVVQGNLPWTDWHEEIVTPGWNWGPAFITVNGQPPPGMVHNIVNQDWPNRGGKVWWTFNPLPPGTVITISKDLWWVGNPNVQGDTFSGYITINEYPTPEPTTLALLVLGGLAMIRRRV